VIPMTIKILPPDEAAKKARERVAEWKRQREMDAAKTRAEARKEKPEPERNQPSPSKTQPVVRPKRNRWAHLNPDIPEQKEKLNEELQNAAFYGSLNKVDELLRAGADINHKRRSHGWTPLTSAIFNRAGKEMIKLLLDRGADVNAKDGHGYTPLLTICTKKPDIPEIVEIVQLILDAGADINAHGQGETTPLHAACSRGFYPTVKALLAAGADPNPQDEMCCTPIMAASRCAGKDIGRIIQLLVESGADINARDKDGETALKLANFKNKEILTRNGATK